MKVALCANTSWYIYNFRQNLIREISEKGHEVYVVSPFDKHTLKVQQLGVKWLHIDLHQTSINPLKEIHALLHLFFLVNRLKPDFLLSFTSKCNLYSGLLARICHFTHIANISGLGEVFDKRNFIHTSVCYLYKVALKKSRKVFFQNREDLSLFIQKRILPEKICERLPGSGVDLSKFSPLSKKNERSTRIFLTFGRIVPQKGYDLFLQVAQNIKNAQNDSAEFWILGIKDTSRKQSVKLFQKILEYHNQGIITYIPSTDNVVPIIQQSDVVILPSQYNEGVPKSLLEALACGKPVLTTNWKGCRDTVDNGINGYLIERDDIASLEKYINFFIYADNEVLQKMGNASRRKAEQEFDEKFVISRYMAEIGNYSVHETHERHEKKII